MNTNKIKIPAGVTLLSPLREFSAGSSAGYSFPDATPFENASGPFIASAVYRDMQGEFIIGGNCCIFVDAESGEEYSL